MEVFFIVVRNYVNLRYIQYLYCSLCQCLYLHCPRQLDHPMKHQESFSKLLKMFWVVLRHCWCHSKFIDLPCGPQILTDRFSILLEHHLQVSQSIFLCNQPDTVPFLYQNLHNKYLTIYLQSWRDGISSGKVLVTLDTGFVSMLHFVSTRSFTIGNIQVFDG